MSESTLKNEYCTRWTDMQQWIRYCRSSSSNIIVRLLEEAKSQAQLEHGSCERSPQCVLVAFSSQHSCSLFVHAHPSTPLHACSSHACSQCICVKLVWTHAPFIHPTKHPKVGREGLGARIQPCSCMRQNGYLSPLLQYYLLVQPCKPERSIWLSRDFNK